MNFRKSDGKTKKHKKASKKQQKKTKNIQTNKPRYVKGVSTKKNSWGKKNKTKQKQTKKTTKKIMQKIALKRSQKQLHYFPSYFTYFLSSSPTTTTPHQSGVDVRMEIPILEPSTEMGKRAATLQSDRVLVAVRVRPHLSRTDGDNGSTVVRGESAGNFVEVNDGKSRKKDYAFDYVFSKGQDEVYDCIGKRMLTESFNGYNTCLFAYGQTGSGKTYTLQGLPGAGIPNEARHDLDHEGLTPRLCRDLFAIIQQRLDNDPDLQVRVTLSLIEVYNEKVRDLLPAVKTPKGQEPPSLDVVEGPNKRIEVRGLTKHPVIGHERMMKLILQGNANREVAETKMNECSSRSHQILQLHLQQRYEQVDIASDKRDTESFITIVDLAGSERQSKTGATGEQFKEATHINHSLLTLGRALNSFSEGDSRGSKVKVPLRDSKLTRLLSECFGGNSKTWMLATVSPSAYNLTESSSTLNYASHAKNITNNAKQNRLARALELHELKENHKKLQSAYDREAEKHRELMRLIEAAEEERARLRESQQMKQEVEELQNNMSQLKLQKETQEREQLCTRYAELHASTLHGLTTPRPDQFLGRAKISLKNIIDQTSSYHTLPLTNESNRPGGFNAVLMVNIYPVDHQVCPHTPHLSTTPFFASLTTFTLQGSAEINRRLASKDLIGQRVDFVVHVICAKGIPEKYSRTVFCQYLYKWAEKDRYKTAEMTKTTDPDFDFKKRFAFSKMNRDLVEYFKSDSVILFEVVGSS